MINKITKKEGQTRLLKNTSKMVCITSGDTNKMINIINNTPLEDYIKATENVPTRQGIKMNNNEVVFQILEGENEGSHSWLSSLTGTKWYTFKSKLDKEYVLIHFINSYAIHCSQSPSIKCINTYSLSSSLLNSYHFDPVKELNQLC